MFSTYVHDICEATSLNLQLAKHLLLSVLGSSNTYRLAKPVHRILQTKRGRYSKAFQVTYSIQSEEPVKNENEDK